MSDTSVAAPPVGATPPVPAGEPAQTSFHSLLDACSCLFVESPTRSSYYGSEPKLF